jgi:photosystem II stability/assembly factor-like uncharacterized protein
MRAEFATFVFLNAPMAGNQQFRTFLKSFPSFPNGNRMTTIKNFFLLMVLLGSYAYSATKWIPNYCPLRTGNWTNSIVFGNNHFLLYNSSSYNGYFSEDGLTWTSFPGNDLHRKVSVDKVCYINKKFYAIGQETFLTSADGVTWVEGNTPNACGLKDLVWGNGMLVGISRCSDNAIVTSPDGIHWTVNNNGLSISRIYYHIVYGNGIFVAVDNFGYITTSTDGRTWTQNTRYSKSKKFLNDILFANGIFIAVCDEGRLLKSTDGITWTDSEISGQSYLFSIIYAGNKFIITCNSGKILTSTDAETWNVNSLRGDSHATNYDIRSIAYGNGKLIVSNNEGDLWISQDSAKTWAPVPGKNAQFNCAVFANDIFAIVGGGGLLMTSSDCVNWTERVSGTSLSLYKAVWGNSRCVVAGDSGTILTSEDFINWTARRYSADTILTSLVFGDSLFVSGSFRGDLFSSPDGIHWTKRYESGKSSSKLTIVYGKGIFLGIDSKNNTMLRSPDGVNWTKGSLSYLMYPRFLTSGDPGFITQATTQQDSILFSTDGMNWQEVSLAGLSNSYNKLVLSSAVFAHGYFLVADFSSNRIIYSSDGKIWFIDSVSGAGHGIRSIYHVGGRILLINTGEKAGTLTTSRFDPTPTAISEHRNAFPAINQRHARNEINLPGSIIGKSVDYFVVNISGRVVYRGNIFAQSPQVRLTIPHLSKGIYFIQIAGVPTAASMRLIIE